MARYEFFDDEVQNYVAVTRADIATCGSAAQLEEWWYEFEDLKMRLRTQVEARILTETDDDEWLCKVCDKISFCSRGMHYVQKRMKELGLGKEPVAEQLERMKVRAHTAEAQEKELRHFKRITKERLPFEQFRQIEIEAREALAA